MRFASWFGALAAGATAVTPLCGAQAPVRVPRRELVGVIREAGGTPVEGATVDIRGASALTNARGAFQMWTGDVDTVTIKFRHFGYFPVEALISARNRQWDTVLVEMERNPQLLSSVNVTEESKRRATGYREFEDRRKLGLGQFVTREEIEKVNTSRSSDLVTTKRGIKLVPVGPGRYGVRFALYAGTKGPRCIPEMWLDGQHARGMEIDDIPPNDIQGIELYESFGSVPLQFTTTSGAPPCGTIVVWTRVPGAH